MESLNYTYILEKLITYKLPDRLKPHMRNLWLQSGNQVISDVTSEAFFFLIPKS